VEEGGNQTTRATKVSDATTTHTMHTVAPLAAATVIKTQQIPYMIINKCKRYQNDLSNEEILDHFDEYFKEYTNMGHCCVRKSGGSKVMKCNCLWILQE
jgi:hypothetical protein